MVYPMAAKVTGVNRSVPVEECEWRDPSIESLFSRIPHFLHSSHFEGDLRVSAYYLSTTTHHSNIFLFSSVFRITTLLQDTIGN